MRNPFLLISYHNYHNGSYSKFLLFFIIIIIKLISHVPGFGARLIVAFLCGWLCPCTPFPLLLNNFFEFHFNDGNRHMFLFVWFSPSPPNPSPKTGKEKQDATERNGDAMEQGVPLSISWKYCLTDHNANTLPFLCSISSFSSCPCFHSCLILIHSLHSSQSGIFKTIKSYHSSYENPSQIPLIVAYLALVCLSSLLSWKSFPPSLWFLKHAKTFSIFLFLL